MVWNLIHTEDDQATVALWYKKRFEVLLYISTIICMYIYHISLRVYMGSHIYINEYTSTLIYTHLNKWSLFFLGAEGGSWERKECSTCGWILDQGGGSHRFHRWLRWNTVATPHLSPKALVQVRLELQGLCIQVLELVEGTLLYGILESKTHNLKIWSNTGDVYLLHLRPKAETGEPMVFYKKLQVWIWEVTFVLLRPHGPWKTIYRGWLLPILGRVSGWRRSERSWKPQNFMIAEGICENAFCTKSSDSCSEFMHWFLTLSECPIFWGNRQRYGSLYRCGRRGTVRCDITTCWPAFSALEFGMLFKATNLAGWTASHGDASYTLGCCFELCSKKPQKKKHKKHQTAKKKHHHGVFTMPQREIWNAWGLSAGHLEGHYCREPHSQGALNLKIETFWYWFLSFLRRNSHWLW